MRMTRFVRLGFRVAILQLSSPRGYLRGVEANAHGLGSEGWTHMPSSRTCERELLQEKEMARNRGGGGRNRVVKG